MKKIRIAQIGFNTYSHSIQILNSLLKQTDIFEVVGYVLPENERTRLPETVEKFAHLRELTLEEVLNDPTIEAVTVETDEIYLTKYATLAIKAGKHVHMEKPGGADIAEFESLIQAVKESGMTFHIGYMYRYNPFVRELIQRADRGELGRIISVEAHMSCWHLPEMRQWLACVPGGMMFYLGCHLVDLIYRLQGMPKEVIPLNTCSGMDGVTSMDCSMAVFAYEHGTSLAKAYAVERGGFARRQLVVTGEKMTVELNPLEWYVPGSSLLQTTRIVRPRKRWHEQFEPEKCEPMDRYDDMMLSFALFLRGEKENPYTLDHELELYKLMMKACGR